MMSTATQGHAAALSIPKAAPANSFVLHAPLELTARVQLLRFVPDAVRPAALQRIDTLAAQYVTAGEQVITPLTVDAPPDAAALLAAINEGPRSRRCDGVRVAARMDGSRSGECLG